MGRITLDKVRKAFGEVEVIPPLDLTIEDGEFVVFVGPSGCGKSTLLRTLLGVFQPSKGSVSRKQGLKIGYVPQKLPQDGNLPMTVRRFLSLPSRVSDAQAEAALRETGAEGLNKRQISGLSGGQLQRVLLARAILNEPDILILDEPTQGLDQSGTADFYALIERLRDAHGCAVLLVSHDLHVVMSAADRVICLNGHICCEGAPTVVRDAPEYRELFGYGTKGTLALYQHEHDHSHDDCGHDHDEHTHV